MLLNFKSKLWLIYYNTLTYMLRQHPTLYPVPMSNVQGVMFTHILRTFNYTSHVLSPPSPSPRLPNIHMVPDRHNLDRHLHLCNISLINVSMTMIVLMCNISLMDIKPWLSLCLQLCDLSLMDYGSLHFRYSIIAASALYHHTNEHLVADVSGNLV